MSLREWSVWRIVAVWLGWPVLLAALGLAAIFIAIWRTSTSLPPGAAALPRQGGDFVVVLPPGPAVLLLVLAPPALVTAAWLWQRRGRGAGPRPPNEAPPTSA